MKSVLIGCGIIIILYIVYRIYKFKKLDNGLGRLVENGAVILDVRTEREYKTGHIQGSKNISLGTIRNVILSLIPLKHISRYVSTG